MLYGSVLGSGERVAVIIEQAGPRELAAVIMSAYGLSAREREVTQLVLQGRSTDQIAAVLRLSPYTVQDYLKSIFDKVGVRTRRQLAGVIFREHYQPRAFGTDRLRADGWFAGVAPQARSADGPASATSLRATRATRRGLARVRGE